MIPKVKVAGTELHVSRICYGTNMLGTVLDQRASSEILDHFVSLGGNFIDTARGYGDWVPDVPKGASERAIGGWLRGRKRDGLIIATKGGMVDLRAGDWRSRVTVEDITQDLTESLDHLGIKSIDLYWLHADNPDVSVEPIMDMLIAHQDAGRIRYFGASNWAPERIRKANAYAASIGRQGFVASQTFWGLAVPNAEAAAAQGYQLYYEGNYESLHGAGLPIIPFSGQSGGYFTKLAAGGEAALSDALRARYANSANDKRLAAVQAIAREKGVSINEIALAYLLNQPYQTIPIIGASSPKQLDDSVKSLQVQLTLAELARLRGED